jgi:hypothetical protein
MQTVIQKPKEISTKLLGFPSLNMAVLSSIGLFVLKAQMSEKCKLFFIVIKIEAEDISVRVLIYGKFECPAQARTIGNFEIT